MTEKLCVFCQNCELDIDGYESSGYYGVVNCGKGHWYGSYNAIPSREILLMAENCKDYKQVKA